MAGKESGGYYLSLFLYYLSFVLFFKSHMFYLKYIRHAYVRTISQMKSPFPVGSSTNSLATSHHYLSLGPLMHLLFPTSGCTMLTPCFWLSISPSSAWKLLLVLEEPPVFPDFPRQNARSPVIHCISFWLSSYAWDTLHFTSVSVSFIRLGGTGSQYLSVVNADRSSVYL